MGKINYGRVLIGGLLAAVVLLVGEFILNMYVVAEEWQAFMQEHGFPEETPGMMILYILVNVAFGIVIVLQYALIRPRCGPGPKTAIWAGLFVWFIAWFLGFGPMGVWMGTPTDLVITTLVWGIIEVPLAGLAGGWMYREG